MKLQEMLQTFLQTWIKKGNSRPMTPKEKWMLLLLAGILAAVILFPMEKKESEGDTVEKFVSGERDSLIGTTEYGGWENNSDLNQYASYLSDRLEHILSQIDGAGEVESWVTLSGSSEEVLYEEKDEEQKRLEEADSVGGSRTDEESKMKRTVLKDHNGNPYVVKILQPEVEGVLVVAEGAGNSTIKKNITEAVQVLFGIEAHRIKVVKRKAEE